MKLFLATFYMIPFCVFALEVKMPSGIPDPGYNTAASELKEYTEKITGNKNEPITFTLATDQSMPEQAWKAESVPDGVKFTGGSPAGLLYAVHHYLEDVCGVHWWSYWEESVPKLKEMPVKNVNISGNPGFRIRDIFALYANDN